MMSWDGVNGHSIKKRGPRMSMLWCGIRATSPARLKKCEITCRNCERAIIAGTKKALLSKARIEQLKRRIRTAQKQLTSFQFPAR